MPSDLKILQTNAFTGGSNSDIADELLSNDQYRYMLNCNVLSTAEGNQGVVTNIKGNVKIPVELPAGENKTIGVGLDEESKKFYYAIWNSNGFHSWYMFDAVSYSCTPVITCIKDTGGDDIFKWVKTDLILHVNIINNNLLYWSLKGHPARKLNIAKALDKNPQSGYGDVIFDEFTRAYKRPPASEPDVRYTTDPTKKFNRVYGLLFKFCYRFIYDDGEKSNWSDFSKVAVPYEESYSGTKGVPETNNGIIVSLLTGSEIVEKIEIAMQRTNPEGGVMNWVSIATLDKNNLDIESNGQYEFLFFNDVSPIATDQEKIIRPYSFLPKNPECQEFTDNSMIYANFYEGFPIVDVDMDFTVRYDDLFLDSGVVNGLNNPEIRYTLISQRQEGSTLGKPWRHTRGDITIGPDVKKGNIFVAKFTDGSRSLEFSVEAGLSDTSETIASRLASRFKTHSHMSEGGGWVGSPVTTTGGYTHFEFNIWNNAGRPYYTVITSVNRVNVQTLKDNGQSVNNIKFGSSKGYALMYSDEDMRKSLVYSDDIIVPIKNINELGGLKRPVITFAINHKAPSWATSYEIVRTADMVYADYIQLLIQQVSTTTISGDQYTDLVVGSLYAYQRIHPNSTLQYTFKKGDRVRLVRNYNGTAWSYPTNVKDYEVIEYQPVVSEVINKDVKVLGTNIVEVQGPDASHIGSHIVIDGNERQIINVTASGYELSSNIGTNHDAETWVYPAFEIINRRGIIRIKTDPAFPITADPSTNKFSLVEVYQPSVNAQVLSDQNYFSFGYSFPIIQEGGLSLHTGNTQNQTASQPALVEVAEGNNYIRLRGLPTNVDEDNPQLLISHIEDPGFSDFYVSDLSSDGRLNVLDTSDGVIHFGSRIRFSNNYIEGTRVNGLNDFDNLDRVDYNDKYGDIKRLLFDEGKLYVFKDSKYAWVPVYGNIIQDQQGTELIAQSSELLPKKLQYYLWEGGVGNNPESVTRDGNNVFSVSPNSGVICRLGGNGIIPISKTYSLDSEVRVLISNASLGGARMYGAFDRKNGNYVVSVEGYDTYVFNQQFFASDWAMNQVPASTAFKIVTPPLHGTVSLIGDKAIYSPSEGFIGEDEFTYTDLAENLERHVCITVQDSGNPKAWRPINPYCITE